MKVLCSDGVQHTIPKIDYLPDPEKAKTGFSFSLDFYARGQNELTYNDRHLRQPLLDYVATGIEPCLTSENKTASLANEVIAYQTMARYLLLETGFDPNLVSDLRSGKVLQQSWAKQKLKAGLERHLLGTNLNPAWANDLMLHYFGIGGLSGHENLTTFVNQYYTSQQAPGFVDSPNCGK